MSTYYKFQCPACEEIGGFFSRQMWGWGNCDIFENFKFMVAHHNCGAIKILSEHADAYHDDEQRLRWLERLASDEDLRDDVWPHASEWAWVEKGWTESHAAWRKEFEEYVERERRHRKQETA